MIHATAVVLTQWMSGPKATSTLRPMTTKHTVSTRLCPFRPQKLFIVPAMAASQMKMKSAQPQ